MYMVLSNGPVVDGTFVDRHADHISALFRYAAISQGNRGAKINLPRLIASTIRTFVLKIYGLTQGGLSFRVRFALSWQAVINMAMAREVTEQLSPNVFPLL